LFKARESIGGTLVTIHNVAFMNRLMQDIRNAIKYEAGGGAAGNEMSRKGEGDVEGDYYDSMYMTLEEVEQVYVHPGWVGALEGGSQNIGS